MLNSIFSHNEVASREAQDCFLDSCSVDNYKIIQSCCLSDDYHSNLIYPPITRLDGVGKAKEEHFCNRARQESNLISPLASFRLLNSVSSGGFKRLMGASRMQLSKGHISIEAKKMSTISEGRKLSTEETIRLAGEMLVDASFSRTLGGLSEEEMRNVQIAQFLLTAAEKISQQQFESGIRFLDQCDYYSDDNGNPVERVIYYFSEALRERVDRETRRVSDKGLGKKRLIDMEKELMTNQSATASQGKSPFSKINQFPGIQAIVENVIKSNKIHIIDLGIRSGMQWVLLTEALATRQDSDSKLELLKITAIGTNYKHLIEETCKRLKRFAETKKLPFCYKIVMVSDFLDLKEEVLQVKHDETVAVLSEYVLRSLLSIPDRLEYVMKVIAQISPAVMVIVEVDANHNSPVFADRFIEALFFFSTYFDCLGECLSDDEINRKRIEGVMFAEGIRNMVGREGDERKIRNVRLQVWRRFMERFGPEEVELSMSSMYQANLLLKGCPNWNHCTLQTNGKSLVICWKGVPINFVSVWKFPQQSHC